MNEDEFQVGTPKLPLIVKTPERVLLCADVSCGDEFRAGVVRADSLANRRARQGRQYKPSRCRALVHSNAQY